MEAGQIQSSFFNQIKKQLPPHLSLVDEVADVLNVSSDSAYRRIRGEKQISFEEIQKLSVKFGLSLDQFLHLKSDSFLFNGRITNDSDFNYDQWLELVVQQLTFICMHNPRHHYYVAKEIPFFYYYLIPEIAAFKSFFFMKSILHYADWKLTRFSVKDDYSRYNEIWKKISDSFAAIPSTEIWSIENITSTLHQIEFYRVTGALKSDEDALVLLEKFEELLSHIEKQAEYGIKLRYKQSPAGLQTSASYHLYSNEIIMGDNMQQILMGTNLVTYINHSILNFIYTTDEVFNDYMKRTISNLTQKSTPISETNEKERLLFFNRIRAKINASKELILK
ncbi:MAG TPA: hypothetical protein PLA68_04270 [Panacibacter sp.]|nr:hypothetical protein [Panacibacter sp.]